VLCGLEGVSVVTSTYNERENVEKLIPALRKVFGVMEVPHEIIVVDDSSPDGTYAVAERLADKAIKKVREGQTKALAVGIENAFFPTILTIDADFENDPRHIPSLLEGLSRFDVVVACRNRLPRFSERIFSLCFSRFLGCRDVLSNYRATKKDVVEKLGYGEKETFGAEFLIRARKMGFKIGEVEVKLLRRSMPRLGSRFTANLKILVALMRCIEAYLSLKPHSKIGMRQCSYSGRWKAA